MELRLLLRPLAVFLCFSVLDFILTTTSLGFYAPGFHFDISQIFDKLLLVGGFRIQTSAVEFVGFVFIRLIVTLGALVLITKRRFDDQLFYFLNVMAALTMSYSLVKVLCFSEVPVQLQFAGCWFSVAWNSTAAIILQQLLSRQHGRIASQLSSNVGDYNRLDEETTPAPPRTTPAEVTEVGQPAESRVSALRHIFHLALYCKTHWRWYSSGCVFLLLYSASRVFIPYYVGQIVADVMHQARGEESHLFQHVAFLSGLTVVSVLFAGLRGGVFTQATALVNRSMRRDLFDSLVHQDMAFFDKQQSVSGCLGTQVNVFLRNSVMLIGSLVFMFSLSWRLSMITFIAIPPLTLISKYYGSYYDKLSEATQTAMADANKQATEVLGSMRTVRAFACEDMESQRYEDKLDVTVKINKRKAIAYTGYVWVNEASENVVLIAVLLYAGHLVGKGLLEPALAASFLFYQMQLTDNFTMINYVFGNLMEAVGASRKVLEFIQREPAIRYDGQLEPLIKGRVQFEDVHFSYPERPNTKVLSHINMDINPGQTAALVGASGAGKSSIIALLEHFYSPTTGRILIDGVELQDFGHKYLHRRVALVAQEPTLYAGTIRENILYGCDPGECGADEVVAAARLANAHDFIMAFSDGYETVCGEKGVQMSGGQKQRIAIARALIRQPTILILDEATSALDADAEHVIQHALRKCSVGRTVIVIAHRLSTVERADRILVLEKGCIVQAGNHQSLMLDEQGIYYRLVQRQLLNANHDE